MTTHLVTFSDESMSRSRELCATSAKAHGVVSVIEWDEAALHRAAPGWTRVPRPQTTRGFGYWGWKPFIVHALMATAPKNSIIIYSDAGIEFINNVNYIIDRMDQDIFLFGNNWEHAHWCKRDVVEEVWDLLALDQPYYDYSPRRKGDLVRDNNGDLSWENFGKQVQASVIFFRVSDYTRKFVKEWLDWCLFEGGRLIDDSPSRTPNHPEFREHRHDQAILTTLAYREGLKLHWWPSVYNRGGSPEFIYEQLPCYAGDDYPVIVSHHRRRNVDWEQAA